MLNSIPDDDLNRVRAAAAAGEKIEAIKLYRAATGAGLAEAVKAVEALQVGQPITGAAMNAMSKDDIDQIEAALFAGKRIQAIRLYRGATREGLKEAKDFIDALEAELRRTEPEQFTAPPAKGCGTAVLALLTAVAVLTWIALA
jgi:ribosomal protein L7/L12